MFILQKFVRIQMVFYLFGLTPCHFTSESQEVRAFFRSVPLLVSFITNICVTLLQFFSFYLESFGQISKLLNYAFYVCILFSNVTANWQCWYYEPIYRNIVHRVHELEKACKIKLSVKMPSKSFKRWYALKATLIIVCYSGTSALVLGQAWFIGDDSTRAIALASLTVIKEFMSGLAALHFMLYVDIVRLFMTELNDHIRWAATCSFSSTKIAFLTNVKSIHMDIFLLMKQLNSFFGWHLLILMIHYFILITYSCYWIFLTIQKEGQHYSIAESLVTLTYSCLSVTVMVNSCEYCSQETIHLLENVDRYGFNTSDNIRLDKMKNDLMEQITNFPLDVTAKGYFTLNRRLLSSIASNCCTYLIVLIQFFLYTDRV